jgi:hypothetical protein
MSGMSMGFDNDQIKSSNFEKFKGEKGKKYRIGFVAADFATALSGAQQHYYEKPFLCKSTDGEQEICCTHNYQGNTPKWKVGGAIIQYTLINKDGKKVWDGDYAVKPWIFNERIYSQLKTMHQEWDLSTHDVELECTDDKFQSFTITVLKNSLWNREESDGQKKLRATILKDAAKISKNIPRNLGQDLSLSEIRELLGLDNAGAGDAAEDIDMSDIADDLD